MSGMDEDTEALVRVIAGNLPGYPAPVDHVAAAILASDWLAARDAQVRAEAWDEAYKVVERQTDLTELVHFERPSDFRKGVLTCLTALRVAMEAKG